MKRTDILIVGGGIAGYTAAQSARQNFRDKKITLVQKEENALLPWGLPYSVSAGALYKNVIPNTIYLKQGIELIIDVAIAVEPKAKNVTTSAYDRIAYDKLILATGTLPLVPSIRGAHLKGVFAVKKDLPYLNNMGKALAAARNLIIIGGGFTGIEFADACCRSRMGNITIIEQRPHCLSRAFNDEISTLVEEKLLSRDINVICEAEVQEFLGKKRVEQVKLTNGRTLPADMVILATGVVPHSELARKAGLDADELCGIRVDRYMRTSDANIFAIGDCAEKSSVFGPGSSLVKPAAVIGHEARIAVANLYDSRQFRKTRIDKFTVLIGDYAFGSAGLVESKTREMGIEVATIDWRAENLVGKVVYTPTNRVVIGAKVYGRPLSLVRKTVSQLADAIQQQKYVDELVENQPTFVKVRKPQWLTGAG